MLIYIADDDDVIRRFISLTLKKAGHEVREFPDGEALIEAYAEAPTRIIVTDWMMPKASGIDVCRRIRALPDGANAHIVMVTALSPDENLVEAYYAGADEFLCKPVGSADLRTCIEAAERGIVPHATRILRNTLEVRQAAYGASHLELLETLDGLVSVTREQRALAQCRAFLRRQVAIAETCLGADSVRTKKLVEQLDALSASHTGA